MRESELKDLVAAAKHGDERACAELTHWAMAQLRDGSQPSSARAAATIAADALRQAMDSWADSDQQPTSAWFVRLLQIDERVRHARHIPDLDTTHTLRLEGAGESGMHSSGPMLPDNSRTGFSTAPQDSPQTGLAQRTEHSLATLPAQERPLLELRYWTGCSLQDIARRHNCSESEVARQLRQALASFRRAMIGEEGHT